MKLLSMPERMILLNLYSQKEKNLDDITDQIKMSTIDCFNALQRLLVKGLISYHSGRYCVQKESIQEIRSLLQMKELKNLEIEQILKSTLYNENPSIRLQEVQCSLYDLKILRHYFTEIERYIEQIKVKKDKEQDKYYFFWGEQPQQKYLSHFKKQYSL